MIRQSRTCGEPCRTLGNPKSKIVGVKKMVAGVLPVAVFFIGAILSGCVVTAFAQTTKKIPRVGYLSASSYRENNGDAFRQGLRELGYVEGKNMIVEF
jgi:hypothetical protein